MSAAAREPVRNPGRLKTVYIVCLLGWLLNASLVFLVEYPPVQDYPNHLLRQHIIENIDEEPYDGYLAYDPSFRPNLTSDFMLGVLGRFFDLELAGKVLLTLELLAIIVGSALFLRRFGPSLAGAFLAVHLSASWLFLKGLINFGFGVGFGLAWLSVIWVQDRIGLSRWLLAAGLGVATVASHGFAFLAFSFLIFAGHLPGLEVLSKKALTRLLTIVPGLVIFALFILNVGQGSNLGENRFVYAADIEQLILWNPLVVWARQSGMLDESLGVVAWSLLLVACLMTCRLALQSRRIGEGSPLVTVWGFLLGSLGLYVLLPDGLSGGWGFMKFRICLILFFTGLPLLAYLTKRLRIAAAVVASGVWVLGFSLSVLDYRDFSHDVSAYMEVADELPQEAVVLSLNFLDRGKTLNPYQHIWGYACIRKSCLSQELFADEYVQQIYFVRPLQGRKEVVPPYEPSSISEALDSGQYDAVLVAGEVPTSFSKSNQHWEVAAANREGTLLVPK